MIYSYFSPDLFPGTYQAITTRFDTVKALNDSIAVYGGGARSGLLEVTLGVRRPIRDVDLVAIGDAVTDEQYTQMHKLLNPSDYTEPHVERHPDLETLFKDRLDFTMNQVAILLGARRVLVASTLAVEACRDRLIVPTEGRIRETKKFEAGGDETAKQYLRNRTNVPARAAYFAAVFRAAGLDFDIDLLDHPRPTNPEESHSFFLGLMVRKSLMVDEAERGPGDITATNILIELYRELHMTASPKTQTLEDVVKFCQDIHEQHPHLKFYGSVVAALIQHIEADTQTSR